MKSALMTSIPSYHVLHVCSRWEDVGSDLVVIIQDCHHVVLTDEASPPHSVDPGGLRVRGVRAQVG